MVVTSKSTAGTPNLLTEHMMTHEEVQWHAAAVDWSSQTPDG